MTRIAVIIGSTRPGRRARAVGDWVAVIAERHLAAAGRDATVEVVDLADHELPLLDERAPAIFGAYEHPHTRRWAAVIGSFDGFVFVTPEYKHSVPASLKNAIDFLYAEWNNKAVGFVSYGSAGGTRAVEHLRLIAGELQMADVRNQVALSLFTDFKDFSVFRPNDFQFESLTAMLDQVVAWSTALAPMRAR
jgi:NAD(P)H-dependent FMN reductase